MDLMFANRRIDISEWINFFVAKIWVRPREPKCPLCLRTRTVTTTRSMEPFEACVGRLVLILSPEIPVHTCERCDFSFLTQDAAAIRDAAFAEAAKKYKR